MTCGSAFATSAAGAARCSARSKRGCCSAACARCICALPRRRANALAIAQRFAGTREARRMCSIRACRRIPDTPSRAKQMRGGFGGMMSLRLAGGERRRSRSRRSFACSSARLAGVGREPRRASRQRRRSGNALPARPRAAVDRRRARRRPDRRHRAGAGLVRRILSSSLATNAPRRAAFASIRRGIGLAVPAAA